jgi:hypothetical protein
VVLRLARRHRQRTRSRLSGPRKAPSAPGIHLGIAPPQSGHGLDFRSVWRGPQAQQTLHVQVPEQGAIGTAAIETFFTKREQYHSFIINNHVSLLQPATRSHLDSMQQYFMSHGVPDPASAMHRAIITAGETLRAQATVMGYSDCFALIGVILIGAVVSVAVLRKGAAAGGGAH